MPETCKEEYIEMMRESLKRHLNSSVNNPGNSDNYLYYLMMGAQGRCGTCGEYLKSVDVKKSNRQRLITAECNNGHKNINAFIEEVIGVKESFAVTSLGEEKGGQIISSRIINWRPKKESDEILAAKRFANHKDVKFDFCCNDKENSPIDVFASVGDCKYLFQVTKLYNKDFWHRLYKNNAVEYCTNALCDLVSGAIDRKSHWDKNAANNIILLIDSWPGVNLKFVDMTSPSLLTMAGKSNFKEIWIVGVTKDSVCRLWP